MAKATVQYDMSIRCHFSGTDYTQHRVRLPMEHIKKWCEAYRFTHPNVQSFSIKIWLIDRPNESGSDN